MAHVERGGRRSNLAPILGEGARATGDLAPYIDTTTKQIIAVYRGTDENVHSLYWSTGAVGHDNLTGSVQAPKAAGNPVGYFTAGSNLHHVLYRRADGRLQVLYWTGPQPVRHEDLTKTAQPPAPPAVGDPSPYFDTTRGQNIVAYRGTDRHIHILYWATGAAGVGHNNLTGFVGAPKAAGDPVAYYMPHADVHQLTYRGLDGHLHELWWLGTNPVSHWDLSSKSGAPPATGDPAAYYSAATNTKHVIYRSADGHLHEIRWVPGTGTPTHMNLTLRALAPPAAGDGDPSGYFLATDGTHRAIYRTGDGRLNELRWRK